MKPVSWMSPEQAREYLGFRTQSAFESFVSRERQDPKTPLKVFWLRGRRRFRQVDLDACIEVEPDRGLSLVKGGRV